MKQLNKFIIQLPQTDPKTHQGFLKNLGFAFLLAGAAILNAVLGLVLICLILVVMFFVPFVIIAVLVIHGLMLIGILIKKANSPTHP